MSICDHLSYLLSVSSTLIFLIFISFKSTAEIVNGEGIYELPNNISVQDACDNAELIAQYDVLRKLGLERLKSNQVEACTDSGEKANCQFYQSTFNFVNSEISSRMEDFLKSTGMGSNEQVKQASEIVTKNTTIQAKLIGYKQTKTDAISIDGKYQFYVLIEYPIGKANQALLNTIKQDEVLGTQKDADKAMSELEAEIDKRRKK